MTIKLALLKLRSRQMFRLECYLLSLVLALMASPALAHSEAGVAIDFMGGFMHPIFGPDHVIAMVAVGLWP
jgi:urease accessory protein